MKNILIIQSHRSPLPYFWLTHCLDSVRNWCSMNQYHYRFIGDELFDLLPNELLVKTHQQRVICSDLARLHILQNELDNGYEMVVWLDADFLIFNAAEFIIPKRPYAVGREIWVQHDKHGKLKVYKKVHNAFLLFQKNNSFLDFYTDTAMRLLRLNTGSMPPQFIGPKLLTALHNVAILPVMETAGMLSPMVIKDIIHDGGAALDLFVKNSPRTITGANLCISSQQNNDITEKEMHQLIESLLSKPGRLCV